MTYLDSNTASRWRQVWKLLRGCTPSHLHPCVLHPLGTHLLVFASSGTVGVIPAELKASSEAGAPPAGKGEMVSMLRLASSETLNVSPAEWKAPSESEALPVGKEEVVSRLHCDLWGVRNESGQSLRPGDRCGWS